MTRRHIVFDESCVKGHWPEGKWSIYWYAMHFVSDCTAQVYDDDDVQMAVMQWLTKKVADFYEGGIQKPKSRLWSKNKTVKVWPCVF